MSEDESAIRELFATWMRASAAGEWLPTAAGASRSTPTCSPKCEACA